MNALAQPVKAATPGPGAPLLRTLVLCDLVDSTALVQRLGDRRGAELLRKHDRLARALISAHGGREIDKTDGFLLMFERPVQAVGFALAYLRTLRELNMQEGAALEVRVGIHVGDILSWDNSPDDVAKGAKPTEVEGLVKPITSRLMQLALPNQILLSGVAHALAHRAQGELGAQLEQVRWRTHGRYRFKGIPDPIPIFEVGEEGTAPLKAPPWSGKAHREVPFWRRPATLGIELAVLFMLLAVPAWYLLKPEPAIAFAQRDWVVVGDLKNLTGETAFDDSLETAFRIGLEQSRHVNVLSDLKTRETIKRMQRDPDSTEVDRTVGSEIAIRDGARALILPTIAEIGGRVRITAEVVDPHTQTTVYSESADGVGEASVLPSLDQVNQKLRVRLGEALATVSKESMPLEKVTTTNLDALRAYSRGSAREDADADAEALALYNEAIRIDPKFALAHVAIARIHYGAGENPAALEQLDIAKAMKGSLSVRDALYVDAWHATLAEPAKAPDQWRLLASMYPDFPPATGVHAYVMWQQYNRYPEAIEILEKSLSNKNANQTLSRYLLGALYLGAERYAEALKQFDAAEAAGMGSTQFHASAFAAQRRFDEARAALARDKSGGTTGSRPDRKMQDALFALDEGDLDHARSLLREARAAFIESRQATDDIDLMMLSLDALEGVPDATQLRAHLATTSGAATHAPAVDLFDQRFRRLLVAYLAARQGDVELAREAMGSEGASIDGFPALDDLQAVVDAELARAAGDAPRAVQLLKARINGDELYLTHIVMLDALTASGDLRGALAEAQWLAQHRGRAYSEYNSEWILRAYYVGQSSLALLRAADLQWQLKDSSASATSLAAFRKAWNRGTRTNATQLRIEELGTLLAAPHKDPSAPR